MNFKHREKRKNTRKKIKFYRIDKKTFERFSKIREKKKGMKKRRKRVYSTLTRRELTQKKQKRKNLNGKKSVITVFRQKTSL